MHHTSTTGPRRDQNLRVAIGGIVHETHSFISAPTDLDAFRSQSLYQGAGLLSAAESTRSVLGGAIAGGNEAGWELLPTVYGAALPGGIVTRPTYDYLLKAFLERLKAALPVDGVLLALHGAMVVEDCLDVEADILAHVRRQVADVPIVVVLDMHGNVSRETVNLADVLLAYDTNPHVDTYEKGREAVKILDALMKENLKPAVACRFLPLLLPPQATGTSDLPLRALHEKARAIRSSDPNVVSIAVMAGFAYADTPITGASVIVTTNANPQAAEGQAAVLARTLVDHRQAALIELPPASEAIAQAAAHPGGPVILVDSADNIGGGTPGDGTDVLRAMLQQGVKDAVVVLADADAALACWNAGRGSEVTLSVGGKTDAWHGEPVHVTGRVRALSDGTFTCELPDNHFAAFYSMEIDMGRCAWLRVQGVNLLLTERKTPPFDLAQLRHIGIQPEAQKMITVKSAVAYRAAYMPIAVAAIEMDTRGLCTATLSRFPYRHLRRPIFPLEDPFAGARGEETIYESANHYPYKEELNGE